MKNELYLKEGSTLTADEIVEHVFSYLEDPEVIDTVGISIRFGEVVSFSDTPIDESLLKNALSILKAVLVRNSDKLSETLFNDAWKEAHKTLLTSMVVSPVLTSGYDERNNRHFRSERNEESIRRWHADIMASDGKVIAVVI